MTAFHRAWKNLNLPEPLPNPWYYPSLAEYAGLLERGGLEVTYGTLFDRPTTLEDGECGLRNWLDMFGGTLGEKLSVRMQERLKREVENEARRDLFRAGHWVMDYRRLRVVARKLC
jgi:trans-aconitate 2-methyltransferase